MTAVPERLRPLLAPESPLQDLARRFVAAGHSLYLVGGSVRDALLGVTKPGADYDLTTDARPDAILELVRGWADPVWLQGQAFGTIGAAKGEMRMEITTFRAEVYRPDSRKPSVTFSDSLPTDLSRRDLTVNATETVNRIVDFFPPHQQRQARLSLAGSLRGIVSQRLLERVDGKGRIPAVEVLVATGRAFDKIVAPDETHELEQIIAEGEYYGMQTFDQSLFGLYKNGLIGLRDALAAASHPHDLRIALQQAGLPVGTAV